MLLFGKELLSLGGTVEFGSKLGAHWSPLLVSVVGELLLLVNDTAMVHVVSHRLVKALVVHVVYRQLRVVKKLSSTWLVEISALGYRKVRFHPLVNLPAADWGLRACGNLAMS
jgi:hypothetical protein